MRSLHGRFLLFCPPWSGSSAKGRPFPFPEFCLQPRSKLLFASTHTSAIVAVHSLVLLPPGKAPVRIFASLYLRAFSGAYKFFLEGKVGFPDEWIQQSAAFDKLKSWFSATQCICSEYPYAHSKSGPRVQCSGHLAMGTPTGP